ncbi:hypothetical protein F5Y03DRAFT_400235 [Xylaria venustula]|nr:hypothetical protein F5Y03DRAFT_400235 [Xylaria venustula]
MQIHASFIAVFAGLAAITGAMPTKVVQHGNTKDLIFSIFMIQSMARANYEKRIPCPVVDSKRDTEEDDLGDDSAGVVIACDF